jgi:predicted dinucleotide-binding enzyme
LQRTGAGSARVLILGGYGAFGHFVARRLAATRSVHVIVAGRSLERALHAASELATTSGRQVTAHCLDAADISAKQIEALGANVVINASGPFQRQDTTLARACIAAGAHYVDLADAREFVMGIGALDAEAREADVLVASGASTVPALSGAVVDALRGEFASLEAVETIIAPGNSFDPGLSTARSILGGLGRPIEARQTGAMARGWQGLRRVMLPGLGARWIGHCDAPDRDLFLQRYPGLQRANVYAALEVGAFHLGLWGLSGLVRTRVLRRPERLARPLLAAKQMLGFLGSDRGGMLVTMRGTDAAGRVKRIDWHLVAGSGHGPFIPAIPSVLLAKRLLDGTLQARGAMPCLGLFTLDEFLAEAADLDIAAGSA